MPSDKSDSFGYTSNAFIFSLRNNENLPFKSNVTDPATAIYKSSHVGPVFGGESAGHKHDIYVAGVGSYSEFAQSYAQPNGVKNPKEILAGSGQFSHNKVEVFHLV